MSQLKEIQHLIESRGRRLKKRDWHSFFTGGFGKRSPGEGVAGGAGVWNNAGDGQGADEQENNDNYKQILKKTRQLLGKCTDQCLVSNFFKPKSKKIQ